MNPFSFGLLLYRFGREIQMSPLKEVKCGIIERLNEWGVRWILYWMVWMIAGQRRSKRQKVPWSWRGLVLVRHVSLPHVYLIGSAWSILEYFGSLPTNKAARRRSGLSVESSHPRQAWLPPSTLHVCAHPPSRCDHIKQRSYHCRSRWIVDLDEVWILKSLNLDPKMEWTDHLGTISNAKNDLIDEVLYAAQAGDMYTRLSPSVMRLTKRTPSVGSSGLLAIDHADLASFDQHPVLTYRRSLQYIHVTSIKIQLLNTSWSNFGFTF